MPNKKRDRKGRVLRSGEAQRADGKYMYRYTDREGNRRTVYSWKLVDTDSLKDGQRCSQSLREMEKAIQKDLDDGIDINKSEQITVDDLYAQFMDIRRDLRESTRCCYNDIYKKHISPAIGHKPIGTVRPTDIQKLYHAMVNEGGVRATTAQKAHSIIYQMFEIAVIDNVIRVNPSSHAFQDFRKTAELIPPQREPLTEEQQSRFVDYIYSSKQYSRMANLFTVLLGTGMRIGEALGLRWCDCDFEDGIIHVTHALLYKPGEDGNYRYRVSSPKTKAGFREIPMLNEVKAALLRERKKRHRHVEKFVVDGYSDFVFLNNNGQVYTQSFIYDVIQGITTSYNKEEYAKAHEEKREPCYLPKISAHILRHTFCTRMSENSVNIEDIKVLQDIMGHRNIRTTMEVYTKALKDRKLEVVQALNGAFKIS